MMIRRVVARAAIVVLLLAVLLCLSLGAIGAMDDGMGQMLLVCCFGLGVVVSIRRIRSPVGSIVLTRPRTPCLVRASRLGPASPRAPDLHDLGVLLI